MNCQESVERQKSSTSEDLIGFIKLFVNEAASQLAVGGKIQRATKKIGFIDKTRVSKQKGLFIECGRFSWETKWL